MRYIDADKLYPDCMTKNGTLAISQSQIANAPTVAEDYDTGYQDGLEDGLNDIRQQGEWIDHGRENLLWGQNECPFCHKRSNKDANFCQYCGARMKVIKNG